MVGYKKNFISEQQWKNINHFEEIRIGWDVEDSLGNDELFGCAELEIEEFRSKLGFEIYKGNVKKKGRSMMAIGGQAKEYLKLKFSRE